MSDIAMTPPHVVLFGRRIDLPRRRAHRIALGYSFIVGGFFSFLPVLGPWMFPVGYYILSIDSSPVRRSRRRWTIYIGRRWPRFFERIKGR